MKIFKNYACHRVYDSPQHYLTQSVVSIADNGEVMECKPLSQETAFTEWIGGVIVLSPESEITLPIDFKTLRQQSTKGNESSPLYAWHISDFNFQEEALSPQSLIRRLPFSV